MRTITPDWPVSQMVKAFTITRPNQSLSKLEVPPLPTSPFRLQQTHSTIVLSTPFQSGSIGDASICREKQHVLAIKTADCLPILLAHQSGKEVAAIHAGWRGLCHGIIEKTLQKLSFPPNEYAAWIGPAICAHCFEVGDEVIDQFVDSHPFSKRYCFYSNKWHINLAGIAHHILRSHNLQAVYTSNLCTFEQKNLFYSYRREGQTGRMETFIWIDSY